MEPIKLIVGLANPGAEYANTRHNMGAWYLKRLALHYQVTLKAQPRFSAQIGQMTWENEQLYLLIPTVFMNLSGYVVAKFANFHRIQPQQILIAHDELDLAPGVAKFKQDGGHAGHNGLRDIIQQLRQQRNFYRLRIGIGHPGVKERVVGFVLSCAPEAEQALIDHAIDRAVLATEPMLQLGVADAMRYLQPLKIK